MTTESTMRRPKLRVLDQLGRPDWIFAGAVIGLAISLGMSSVQGPLATQLLLIMWSALAGMMVPQIRAARRVQLAEIAEQERLLAAAQETTEARKRRADDERARRHDLAAALLTLEGGVSALRSNSNGEEQPIVDAIEAEIARVRRLSQHRVNGYVQCEAESALRPIISLHQACGMAISAELDPALVAIPGDDLVRVAANVLDNCSRHAPGASVTITNKIGDGRCLITITDDGPGIPAELVDSVTELDVSTRDGGGVGLHSAVKLLKPHGAALAVPSPPGAGSSVVLDLPLAVDRRGPRRDDRPDPNDDEKRRGDGGDGILVA